MADDDGFTLVSRRSGSRRKGPSHHRQTHSRYDLAKIRAEAISLEETESNEHPTDEQIGTLLDKLNGCLESLSLSDFARHSLNRVNGVVSDNIKRAAAHCKPHIHQAIRIVAYGVGNFSRSMQARYQLCFLKLLAGKLEEFTVVSTELFDPFLDNLERNAASKFGLNVLSENEEGKRVAEELTVFYMPHCPITLYNNLLWANWSVDKLKMIVIIGNSFANYEENTIGDELKHKAGYIHGSLQFVSEDVLPNTFEVQSAFNNTSIHWFQHENLFEASASIWDNQNEPVPSQDGH